MVRKGWVELEKASVANDTQVEYRLGRRWVMLCTRLYTLKDFEGRAVRNVQLNTDASQQL